jgi:hypothetical protein
LQPQGEANAGVRFGHELRRRHALRVAVAYAGGLCGPIYWPPAVPPSNGTAGIDHGRASVRRPAGRARNLRGCAPPEPHRPQCRWGRDAMSDLWQSLGQRKLVQWAIAYLASAWILLQVLGLAAQSYEWPTAIMRMAFILMALGFVVALVLLEQPGLKELVEIRKRNGAFKAP